MDTEYETAKLQSSFNIIEDNGNKYVVISSSDERFSTYLCSDKYNTQGSYLLIDTSVHRYYRCDSFETKVTDYDQPAKW